MDDAFLADMGREAAPDRKPAPEHPGIDRSRWGIFPDVDIAAYHRGLIDEVTLSQGQMRRLIDETPLDFAFHNVQLNPEGAEERILESVAARRGDVVGQLALGRGKGFAIGDFADWRTKDAKTFRDNAVADGKVPIKRKDFEEAEVIADVIVERLKELLDGADYQTEVGGLYQEMTEAGPIWVRVLADVWCPEKRLIVDPKVTGQLYDSSVGRHMANMGWDRQAALYPHAFGMILGDEYAGRVRFLDLMVKPEAPFTSRPVRLDKADEYQAIKECRIAMERFGACLYAGRWPGFDEVGTVELPVYIRKQREARELGEA